MPKHYVNNALISPILGAWALAKRQAIANKTPVPPMPDILAEACMLIATRITLKPNFCRYTYRDDMVSVSLFNFVKYAHSFDSTKTTNAFAYITQIVNNSIFRLIAVEKHALYTKMRYSGETPHTYQRFCQETNADNDGYQKWNADRPTATKQPATTLMKSKIVDLIQQGFTQDEIAIKLHKSPQSIQGSIDRMMDKMALAVCA